MAFRILGALGHVVLQDVAGGLILLLLQHHAGYQIAIVECRTLALEILCGFESSIILSCVHQFNNQVPQHLQGIRGYTSCFLQHGQAVGIFVLGREYLAHRQHRFQRFWISGKSLAKACHRGIPIPLLPQRSSFQVVDPRRSTFRHWIQQTERLQGRSRITGCDKHLRQIECCVGPSLRHRN